MASLHILHVCTIVVLLSLHIGEVNCALTSVKTTINQNSFNVREDAVLTCTVVSDAGIEQGFELYWYKKQEQDFLPLGRFENILMEPFIQSSDKYFITRTYDRATKTLILLLKIIGVEAVDTGDYKCVVGYAEEDKTHSNVVSLLVNPGDSTLMKFTADAPQVDDSYYDFNAARPVTCRAETNSVSSTLSLSIRNKQGVEITQDFQMSTSDLGWTGREGLKLPTVSHKLEAKAWLPTHAGKDELSCYYKDLNRELVVQTLSVMKEEKATVNCASNYKKAVRADDLDVFITCNVKGYSGNPDDITMQWRFVDEETDQNATMQTGDSKYLRHAKVLDNGAFRLRIPRITEQMVSVGKYFLYDVIVHSKGNVKAVIAQNQYPLLMDATRKFADGSSSRSCWSSLVLLLSFISIQALY